MKKALINIVRKGWQYAVLGAAGGCVKAVIKTLFDAATDASFVASVLFLGTLTVYLGMSYARHREACDKALNRALAIQNLPSSKEEDWAPLIFQSNERWKDRKIVIYALLSVVANVIYLGLVMMLTAFDDSASELEKYGPVQAMLFFAIALGLKFSWDKYEESLECRDFDEQLRAANEGHWIPALNDSDADAAPEPQSVRGILANALEELPKECIDSVIKSI